MTETSAAQTALTAAHARIADFCGRLGIALPVMNAPMTGVAGVAMAAAVSEAGGLGVLPVGRMTPGEITQAVAQIRALTEKPFALSIRIPPKVKHSPEDLRVLAEGVSAVMEDLGLPATDSPDAAGHYDFACANEGESFAARFAAIVAARPAAVLSTAGGFREPEAEALEAAGILNFGTATTLREAKVLRAAGVDAIVLQGSEAGGPRSNFEDADDVMTGLAALVPQAARATGLPVIAAGGVFDPAQALGLAVAGASGVMLGTALLGTKESLATPYAKQALTWVSAGNLTLTRLYSGRLERVLRSPLLDALADYVPGLPAWPAPEAVMGPLTEAAARQGREELEAVRLGESAGRSLDRDCAGAVKRIASLLV
ncbi:nitronate monooxygenase family protein [Sutterella sp.]|uniref:NAD(P)H-dependent flavin oxidoreductase n=1 Tax=Sutterella sp. TaxID=1981025 RepID=UPI0026E0F6E3|nr:nitronate monooxygenase [Sutterella sp.]MDO5532397.1 nitronate monooxygenase [Sutterella sp.]